MKTLYGRQFVAMASMILLSFLMLGASFATLSYQYTISEKKDTMGRNAGYISTFTSDYVNMYGSEAWRGQAFRTYLSNVALLTDSHVLVGTNDGEILFATDGKAELTQLERGILPGSVLQAIAGGSFAGMSVLGGLYAEPRYAVGLPVTSGGILQGVVLISCDASNISGMFGKAGDGGHGGLELVRDVGDKLAAALLALGKGVRHGVKGLGQLSHLVLPGTHIHPDIELAVAELPGGGGDLLDGL